MGFLNRIRRIGFFCGVFFKKDQLVSINLGDQIEVYARKTRKLKYLDELEIPYALNPTIVRGLDYYSKTAFEVWSTEEEVARQSALGGGGRYDGLMEMLGGLPTPAVGFAGGCERLINQIKENDIKVLANHQPKIFLAQLGPDAKKKMMVLYEKILTAGIAAAENADMQAQSFWGGDHLAALLVIVGNALGDGFQEDSGLDRFFKDALDRQPCVIGFKAEREAHFLPDPGDDYDRDVFKLVVLVDFPASFKVKSMSSLNL